MVEQFDPLEWNYCSNKEGISRITIGDWGGDGELIVATGRGILASDNNRERDGEKEGEDEKP